MANIHLVIALGSMVFLGNIQGQIHEARPKDGCRTPDCTCCISGYMGMDCKETCNNCMSRVIDGKCIAFCEPGYYGYRCNKSCSSTCATGNTKSHICEKDGTCTNGCISGKYGEYCNLTCHTNCLNGICYPNGDCKECKNSHFFGKFCNTTCSEGCQNKTCSRSGKCMGGCIDGFYGETCEQCGNNCKRQHCIGDRFALYNCTDGCKPGYTGINCSKNCPPHCEECDQEGQRCVSCVDNYDLHHKTGECVEEFQKGPILGGILPVCAIIIAIPIIITVYLKRRQKMPKYGSSRENCDQEQSTKMLENRSDDAYKEGSAISLNSNQERKSNGSSSSNMPEKKFSSRTQLEKGDSARYDGDELHDKNGPGREETDNNRSDGDELHDKNLARTDVQEGDAMLPETTKDPLSTQTSDKTCELCRRVKMEKKNVKTKIHFFVLHEGEVKNDVIAKHAAALMNTEGGQICLHWTSGEKVSDVKKRITQCIQLLTDKTDIYDIQTMQNRQSEKYMEIHLKKTPDVATVKFNTKILTNVNKNEIPLTQDIKDLLTKPDTGSTYAGHDQLKVKKELDCSPTDKVVEHIWEKSKHYISSISKVQSGGIFEVVVKNMKHVENKALKMCLQKFIEENICILASEIVEETKRFFDINIENDCKEEIHIKLTIKKVNGIVFYDPEGPISYSVVDGETKRMDKEEWSRRITEGSDIRHVWSK